MLLLSETITEENSHPSLYLKWKTAVSINPFYGESFQIYKSLLKKFCLLRKHLKEILKELTWSMMRELLTRGEKLLDDCWMQNQLEMLENLLFSQKLLKSWHTFKLN